jgi:SAM-dependent MidA family methyltransferase
MELYDRIAELIRQHGPVSFREFMEMCLYDRQSGYYTSQCKGIGKHGDFYTSPTLTPVFGTLLGKQLEEMWEQLGCRPFTIVEYGAGTGHLCRDILAYLWHNERMYSALRYCIIEKSPVMRQYACKMLPADVEWYDCISEIGEINGCIISNELVDNFAVHRVVMQDTLKEVYVDFQNGFAELLQPASPELGNYFSEMNVKLPVGYSTEINLDALEWISEVALALTTGYVITIDYGFKNPDLYRSDKRQGTLLCYCNHAVSDSFYEHVGEQDITSHVNFSALCHWGALCGLTEAGFTDQGLFLTGLGFREQLLRSLESEADVVLAARKAAWLSQILLLDMGSKYKVLIQQKGVENSCLTGLSLSKEQHYFKAV